MLKSNKVWVIKPATHTCELSLHRWSLKQYEICFLSIILFDCCWNPLRPAGCRSVRETFDLSTVGGKYSQSTVHAVCHDRLPHFLLTWVRISSWPMMCSRVFAKPEGTLPSEAWECACSWCEGCCKLWVWVCWVEEELMLESLWAWEWVVLLWLPLRL